MQVRDRHEAIFRSAGLCSGTFLDEWLWQSEFFDAQSFIADSTVMSAVY
jgi:hypothetical protein